MFERRLFLGVRIHTTKCSVRTSELLLLSTHTLVLIVGRALKHVHVRVLGDRQQLFVEGNHSSKEIVV